MNDVVLAVVSGALGSYMRLHGYSTDGPGLRAMVPVSVRADIERGALGNRVAAVWATLPVGVSDPVARLQAVSRAMEGIKRSGQAVGAEILTQLTGFAPPTVMAQASTGPAIQVAVTGSAPFRAAPGYCSNTVLSIRPTVTTRSATSSRERRERRV